MATTTTTTTIASGLHLLPSSGISRLPSHLVSAYSDANGIDMESRLNSSDCSRYGSSNNSLTHSSPQACVAPGSTSRLMKQRQHDAATSLCSNISSNSIPYTTSTTSVTCSSTLTTIDDLTTIGTSTRASTMSSSASQHKDMPFYGLPLEILQHIASFLPFHGLVRLYTCLPKIHRPIFQLLLDHSLALMMLTLEIRQQSDEQPPTRNSIFVSVNNNPNGIGAVRKLQTHWRVTDFDLDHMRVEFQLEEKLGLEMAERRRREIEYQIQQNRKKSHDPLAEAREQLERSRHGQEDFENLIWRSRTGGMSSSSSTSSLIGSLQQSSSSSLSSSPSTPEVEVSDSNFFHCNGSSHTPTLGSATVSFKAQRNMPAPWIAQNFDFADPATPSPPSSASTSSSASVAPESPGVVRARERVAAYRQNRLLLRALAKMRCREESSRLQFLPVTVELETEELGQKKVEAELVEPNNNSSNTYSGDVHRHQSGHGKTFPATTAGSSSSTIKLGRRHSWQTLRYTDRPGTGTGTGTSSYHHHSSLEPLLSLGSDLSSHGLAKVLKRILRRSSWNGNRSRSHTAPITPPLTAATTGCSVCDPQHHHHLYYNPYQEQQQQSQQQQQQQQQQHHHQRRSIDSLRTVDWSSVFQSVASSMHRSSSSSSHTSTTPTATATTAAVATACQCPHRKAVLLTTSKQQDPSTAAAASAANAAKSSVAVAKRRSFSNMVTGYRKGKTSSSSAPDSSQHDASLVAASGVVDKGKGKGKGKATQSTLQEQQLRREKEREEQHQKLFEFSYGVRHNYLHSHRLEGERVIRPMRFACSLDFFIQK